MCPVPEWVLGLIQIPKAGICKQKNLLFWVFTMFHSHQHPPYSSAFSSYTAQRMRGTEAGSAVSLLNLFKWLSHQQPAHQNGLHMVVLGSAVWSPAMSINWQWTIFTGKKKTDTPFDNILNYLIDDWAGLCTSKQNYINLEMLQLSGWQVW